LADVGRCPVTISNPQQVSVSNDPSTQLQNEPADYPSLLDLLQPKLILDACRAE
jgi:hypothetical protein